jgi:urease accessory protein
VCGTSEPKIAKVFWFFFSKKNTLPCFPAMSNPSPNALLRLMVWLSPAFPTGAFAYSHGIEWAVEEGDITSEATLGDWLRATLRFGAGRNDAILLRAAWAAEDAAALLHVAEMAAAVAPCRERQEETLAQGAAFCLAARPWPCAALHALSAQTGGQVAYPVAVGALARGHGIAQDECCRAYLLALTTNLISAGVRLVPLGQTAGLRLLAALEPDILAVAASTVGCGLEDIGGACLRADIAAMRHETQYTRLFRS